MKAVTNYTGQSLQMLIFYANNERMKSCLIVCPVQLLGVEQFSEKSECRFSCDSFK